MTDLQKILGLEESFLGEPFIGLSELSHYGQDESFIGEPFWALETGAPAPNPGQVFNEVGSGGVGLCGEAALSSNKIHDEVGSGGVGLCGEVALSSNKIHDEVGSGGVRLGGLNNWYAHLYNETSIGGITVTVETTVVKLWECLSGTVDPPSSTTLTLMYVLVNIVNPEVGDVVYGMKSGATGVITAVTSTTVSLTNILGGFQVGENFIRLNEVSLVTRKKLPKGTVLKDSRNNPLTVMEARITEFCNIVVYTPDPLYNWIFDEVMEGGLHIGGQGSISGKKTETIVVGGGIQLGGSALVESVYAVDTTMGCVLGDTVDMYVVSETPMIGGILANTTADMGQIHEVACFDGITLSGEVEVISFFNLLGIEGGCRLAGESENSVNGIYDEFGMGGIGMGGNAEITSSSNVYSTGGVGLNGESFAPNLIFVTSEGGLLICGESDFSQIHEIQTQSGLLVSGEGVVGVVVYVEASAGAQTGGYSLAERSYVETMSGGLALLSSHTVVAWGIWKFPCGTYFWAENDPIPMAEIVCDGYSKLNIGPIGKKCAIINIVDYAEMNYFRPGVVTRTKKGTDRKGAWLAKTTVMDLVRRGRFKELCNTNTPYKIAPIFRGNNRISICDNDNESQ